MRQRLTQYYNLHLELLCQPAASRLAILAAAHTLTHTHTRNPPSLSPSLRPTTVLWQYSALLVLCYILAYQTVFANLLNMANVIV
jgi:hypothetical protein